MLFWRSQGHHLVLPSVVQLDKPFSIDQGQHGFIEGTSNDDGEKIIKQTPYECQKKRGWTIETRVSDVCVIEIYNDDYDAAIDKHQYDESVGVALEVVRVGRVLLHTNGII